MLFLGNPIQGSVVQKPANNNDNIQKNNNLNAGGRIKEIEEKIEENRNYKELLLNIMSVKKESEMEEESNFYNIFIIY